MVSRHIFFENTERMERNMGMCFMDVQKLKTLGELSSKYKHNYRIADVKNADKSLLEKNEELIPLPQGQNYVDFYKQKIRESEYHSKSKVRKDAVVALEVVTTFSRGENVNLEEWKKRNVEWLKKTFDRSPDGKSNIASVIYHADEAGNVHCHAIVIPINEEGRLSARSFVNGRSAMGKLQDSYAQDMKIFGLERGQKRSTAKHQDIRKLYADLNNTIANIPDPQEHESALDYKKRIIEEIQTMQLAALRERNEKKWENDREIAREREMQRELIRQEAKAITLSAKDEVRTLTDTAQELKEEIHELSTMRTDLLADIKKEKKKKEKLDSYQKVVDRLNYLKQYAPKDYDYIMEKLYNHKEVTKEFDH